MLIVIYDYFEHNIYLLKLASIRITAEFKKCGMQHHISNSVILHYNYYSLAHSYKFCLNVNNNNFVCFVSVISCRAASVQTPHWIIQSAHSEVNCCVPTRWHHKGEEDDWNNQSALQQSEHKVGSCYFYPLQQKFH